MNTSKEFDDGFRNGYKDREAFEARNTSFTMRALIADNKRKAKIGARSDEQPVRSYWLGWLAGFNID